VLKSLSWSSAEMQLYEFEVGRVTMMVKVKDRPQLVLMECRKDLRLSLVSYKKVSFACLYGDFGSRIRIITLYVGPGVKSPGSR
jgi:hypothetical protein